MCSVLFRIRCTSLLFLMITINIILHVSVCGTYLFCLVIVYLHNIFHLTGGCILCCARTLIRLMHFVFAFIHSNLTITCLFFLLICTQSLFLALNIIRTQIFFVFIHFFVACNRYVDDFKLLTSIF